MQEELLDHAHPDPALTQSAQAWPPEAITMHAREIRKGVEMFLAGGGGELAMNERELLSELLEHWMTRFLSRVVDGRALTLIHGDFHVVGNVLFAPENPSPRVIGAPLLASSLFCVETSTGGQFAFKLRDPPKAGPAAATPNQPVLKPSPVLVLKPSKSALLHHAAEGQTPQAEEEGC